MRVVSSRLALALCLLAACGEPRGGDDTAACTGGKCDASTGWIAENLAGREDPIAHWLRAQTELDETGGVLHANYTSMQLGVAAIQGCDTTSAKNFIVSDAIIHDAPFPRLVGTVCTDDAQRNWQVFFSPPAPNEPATDLDVHTVEMFAWDATAKQYRFYRTDPADGGDTGAVALTVEPAACQDCHLGHEGLDVTGMPMLPVMNELTQPWEHWNAEPGFTSQEFVVPGNVQTAPHYSSLTTAEWVRSARDLELIIREAHAQVGAARAAVRREPAPASVSTTMSLLRPLFCDEQINYVSEAGTSGQLLIDAVADIGLRDLVKKKQATGWGQKWMDSEARLRMPAPSAGDPLVTMLPVRGNAAISFEGQLASVPRGITPDDAIQIRLIDWQRPVFSPTRCGLWTRANQRFAREQLDVDLKALRNYDLIPILVREIMQLDGVSLLTGVAGEYFMVPDGTRLGEAAQAIASNTTDDCDGAVCRADLAGVVEAVDAHVARVEADPNVRARLHEVRQERTCRAVACFENHPFIPGLAPGCSQTCDLNGLSEAQP